MYRVGFNNFYVITRYNRSTMYAMAVHDLGEAIQNFMRDAASESLHVAAQRVAALCCGARTRRLRRLRRPRPHRRTPSAAAAGARRAAAGDIADDSRCRCRAPSRARRAAIRRSTTCSASAISCSTTAEGYLERGVASWYGPGFHAASDVERRALRHVRDDRRAQDAAAARVRTSHEPAQRPQRGRARERSRAVQGRPHHRSVLHGREPSSTCCKDGTTFVEVRALTPGQKAAPPAPPQTPERCTCRRAPSATEANASRLLEQLRAQGVEKSFVREDRVDGRSRCTACASVRFPASTSSIACWPACARSAWPMRGSPRTELPVWPRPPSSAMIRLHSPRRAR